jgi:hypothetical protein
MIIKRPILILLLFILTIQAAYSNAKTFPGYYINLNGDSIACKIEFHDRVINPTTIIVEAADGKHNFGAADIKGFGIFGYGDYKSATITYHKAPISESNIPREFSDEVETKECFLKIDVAGFYSLYELALPNRFYYFISEDHGAISELIYRVKQNESNISEDQQYKKTFFSLFTKEGMQTEYFGLINNALYNSLDIKLLISKLNMNHPGINSAQLKHRADQVQFNIFIGGLLNTFPTAINGVYESGDKISSSSSLTGGINVFYLLPAHFKSLGFGLSIGYMQYSSTINRSGTSSFYQSVNFNGTTDYTEKISTANSQLLINIYASYFLNPLSRAKFYLKAGLSDNISVKQSRNIYSTYGFTSETVINGLPPVQSSGQGSTTLLPIRSAIPYFNVDLGLMFGRNKIEFAYYMPSDQSASQATFKVGMAGLYYYYTIFR